MDLVAAAPGGLPMKDKFAWLEDPTDQKVVEWARKQDAVARRSVRNISKVLSARLEKYYGRPIMRSVQLTKAGIFLFFSDERSYKVELLHSSDGHRETVANSTDLGSNIVIQGFRARDDGVVGALHYSLGGSDEGSVSIVDVKSREEVDTLHGFVSSIVWPRGASSTLDTYYYVRNYRKEKTPDGVQPPASRVILRASGGSDDTVVFGSGFPTNTFIGLSASSDGSEALIDASHGWTRSTPYAGAISKPETWTPIYRETGSIVSCIDFHEGRHFLLSFEKSLGEVLSVGKGGDRKVVSEGKWPLQEAILIGNKLLCHYLVDACSELYLFGLDGRKEKTLAFPIPGSLIGSQDGAAVSGFGAEAVVAFSSFALPYVVYKLSGSKLVKILSEELPGRYSVKHWNVKSRDGTRVHYFTTTRLGSGENRKKALLFGYGGFRVSLSPSYNPAFLPLIDDGAIYAVANLRGGLEHGEDWHRAGMREKKFSVFEDYIAVLEGLRRRGVEVVGFGRSNGGLLMGATMNARPDLFAGVLIGYPVLDMMAFSRLLMGKAWVPEYGDPQKPEDREFLLRYSPYHNVDKRMSYPPVFIYTGLKDDRVHPAHAFKFYSKLKEAGAKVYLRVEAESGHIGTTPKTRISEEADKLAFVYSALGLARGGTLRPARRSMARDR